MSLTAGQPKLGEGDQRELLIDFLELSQLGLMEWNEQDGGGEGEVFKGRKGGNGPTNDTT